MNEGLMDKDIQTVYSHSYQLTAGECNAAGVMPVTLLVRRVIEVATEHANRLDIGYARLSQQGIGWVLSRVSVEMGQWPGINQEYTVTTWIESFTRFYSDRCFAITDGAGNVIGHVRTMWVAIDIAARTVADLTGIAQDYMLCRERQCPVPRQRKMRPVAPEQATRQNCYTFTYSDIDFNRHVNSVRYIDHILDMWPMDFHDAHTLAAFEIAYQHECLYGQPVSIVAAEQTDGDVTTAAVDIVRDGEVTVAAKLTFKR